MIRLNSQEFARFGAQAKSVDKTILRDLRKGLKDIGQVGVDAVKKAVLEDPPNDQPGSVGSREALAAATRLAVTFSARGGGVKITTGNGRLSAAHRGFAAAYETRGLRHPVYGIPGNEVQQSTRPYFGKTLVEALPDRGQKDMAEVITKAMHSIGAR